jgi:signal transduction histidine kinase/ActR/RegA family two-component response regulator
MASSFKKPLSASAFDVIQVRSVSACDLVSASSEMPAAGAIASLHGQHRWETGWSLTELVRDYQLLRLSIVDFLENTLRRPLSTREAMAIGLELDDAIIGSVNSYSRHRDQHAREQERQRAEQDRSAQEAAREALAREAEALRESDRRKNEFLAVLGHELRNPLGAMANALQLTHALDPSDPDYRQVGEILQRQLWQLERLADDLLDISRITRGVIELRKESVDLAASMQHAAEAVRAFIENRDHQFELRLPPAPLRLLADPARLQQIMANLLVNAAKYTPPGGRISFAASAAGSQAVLAVEDNGIGLPAEMLGRVFDLFMQGKRAPREAESGLGLGLTLVRKLVELHQGTIQVESAGAGKGSRFTVRLPLADDVAAPATGSAHRPTAGAAEGAKRRRLRALIVDDNHDVALTLAALVRHAGHEARVAHDGPAALDAARDYQPEIILVDIGLPGMDGYEVGRRLRRELGLVDALMAALTGYGHEDDRRRSLDAGFDEHLVKPIRKETLAQLIDRAATTRSAGR